MIYFFGNFIGLIFLLNLCILFIFCSDHHMNYFCNTMLTKCFLGNTAGGKLQYKRHFQIFGACLTPIYPSKIETTHPFCFCLLLFSPTFALIWALRIDVLAFIYILQNWYLTQRRDQRMSVDKFSQMFQGSKYHLWHNVLVHRIRKCNQCWFIFGGLGLIHFNTPFCWLLYFLQTLLVSVWHG